MSNHSYLMSLGGNTTSVFDLPAAGETVIGSSSAADLCLAVDAVAGQHAKLVSSLEETMLVPLDGGSVLINGEPIAGPCLLTSGDAIALGAATLVFHRGSPAVSEPRVCDGVQLRRRLREETERGLRYGHPMAVLVVVAAVRPESAQVLERAVAGAVRAVDIVGQGSRPGEVIVVLPETGAAASIPARRVLGAVARLVAGPRGGLACFPTDGVDVDTLLAGARAAAGHAEPGAVALVADLPSSLQAGEAPIVVVDPLMRRLFEQVARIARSDIPVLLSGETGTGKEVVTQALHAWSRRSRCRLLSVNCAAVSDSLLESELFGHERGAFTGAVAQKRGIFEAASGGTVFLDEIGECSPRAQSELLRVLETKRFCRVGGLDEIAADVRIVAATNRSLEEEIAAGRFRRDLFFRLNAGSIHLPPLRDRPLDVAALARSFLALACTREGRPPMRIAAGAACRLALHDWPGNVRELRNLMDYLAAVVQGTVIEARDLPDQIAGNTAPWLLPRAGSGAPTAEMPPGAAPEGGKADGGSGADRAAGAALVEPRRSSDEHRLPGGAEGEEVSGTRMAGMIGMAAASSADGNLPRPSLSDEIRALERTRMQEALAATQGVRLRAAELIGMPLRTFMTKMKEHGLAEAGEGNAGARRRGRKRPPPSSGRGA